MESFGVWVSRGVYGVGLWKCIRSGWDLDSNASFILILVMNLQLDSGMICGKVRSPSRRGILRCSLLSEVVMLQWLIILSVGVVRCIGFLSFFVQCRIGK